MNCLIVLCFFHDDLQMNILMMTALCYRLDKAAPYDLITCNDYDDLKLSFVVRR